MELSLIHQLLLDMVQVFSYHSWTLEAWVYPSTLRNDTDYAIIGQCQSFGAHICLHLNIRMKKLHMGFYGDDLVGITSLMVFKWYHIAFVFDNDNLTQSIYLDGVLDSNRMAFSSYLGNNGSLVIGSNFQGTTFYDGLIDQLSYSNRVKTAAKILDDATLTLSFSFDNGSLYDEGLLRINGSLVGSTSVVSGRKGHAVQFGPSMDSYFRVSGLVLLGSSNQCYSMSIWINPTVSNRSSIIHVSSEHDGYGWCLKMLGLSAAGQLIAFSYDNTEVSVAGPMLPLNSWTHAAVTYSMSNGLRLYVNGTLQNSTIPFAYTASGRSNYLFLGSSLNGTLCIGIEGQFVGALDEFRLYSRELTVSDVQILSQT